LSERGVEVVPKVVDVFAADAEAQKPGGDVFLAGELAAPLDGAFHAAQAGRMLPGIRGVRLTVLQVDAKFKYDDHNPVEHRQRVIGRLEHRAHGLDTGGRGRATAAPRRDRRLEDPPRPTMTSRAPGAAAVPPSGLAVAAMGSVQLDSACRCT
jgi:hypothetical protein